MELLAKLQRTLLPLIFVAAVPSLFGQCSNGTVAVLTGQYDNLRDSVNANETCLTPSPSTFFASDGVTPVFKVQAVFPTLLSPGVENPIYGQPLYVPNVPIGGAKHNVVYVTDLNNVVYAYDADAYGSGSPPTGVLYWSTSLTSNCTETVSGKTYPGKIGPRLAGGKLPYIGIISTPVIDPAAGVIYVVNACLVTGPTNQGLNWYLTALKLGNGTRLVAPVAIQGGVSDSFGSTVFTPKLQLQRSALLLTKDASGNGEVYIAFGAGTAEGATQSPYHGWLFGYTLNTGNGTLQQQSVFTTTPTSATYSSMCDPVTSNGYPLPPNWCGEAGGIWMSGRGPAANVVNGTMSIFAAVANGGFQTSLPLNWGESILKFPAGAAFAPSDSFTPSGWYVDENENDEDLGTSGVVLFDGSVDGVNSHFLVTADKAGNLFLLSQSRLGGFTTPDTAIQEFLATSSTVCPQINVTETQCNEPHSLVYWNSRLFLWPTTSPLRAFNFSNGLFVPPTLVTGASQGFPGGILAISSNGTNDGILWALHSPTTNRSQREAGFLSAIDPVSLTFLWSSTNSMLLSTFAEPTVVNGRVYVPTWDQGLVVYANH